MIDSLVNSIAGEIFTPDGTTHPSMGMHHAQMVSHAYGYRTREWVGLTDEEQQAAYDAWQQKDDGWGSFYYLIEAKLKEKNT